MDHTAVVHAYFHAFRARDRSALEQLLLPALRHSSPFGLYEGRDRMLDEIWADVGNHWAEDIQVFEHGNEAMVRYRHSTGALIAEYFCFDGDRISEIEVYMGRSEGRPAAPSG